MTNHSLYKTKLDDFVMGELSKIEQEEIKAHLNECSECSESINLLKETLKIFSAPNFDMPQKSYFASLAPRVRERAEQKEKKVSLSFLFDNRWVGAFASLLLIVSSAFLLYNLNSEEGEMIVQDAPDYYYSSIQSENYSISGLSATISGDDWELLSAVIDEEIGEYLDIYQYDSDDDQIENLSENEWHEFYENFSKENIL
ncbi:zf-HC2 domain-containing protein [Candidatus Marinimicrobia bacterium MT.SAG.4]|nr:zf-HC2 domain-containing protein [Candidatus Marinimicrobia bacterium MT.SAG.4]